MCIGVIGFCFFKTPFDNGVVVPRVSSRIDRLLSGKLDEQRRTNTLDKVLADLDRLAALYETVVSMDNRDLVAALHVPLWPLKEHALMLARLFRRPFDQWQLPCEDEVGY